MGQISKPEFYEELEGAVLWQPGARRLWIDVIFGIRRFAGLRHWVLRQFLKHHLNGLLELRIAALLQALGSNETST